MNKTYLDNVGQKQRKIVVRWANGKEGLIIDLEKNGVLRFVESCTDIDSNECDKKDMDINYPYVASGIVAWWFKYHKSQKEFELFEKYYRQRLSQYRKKREKEPNSFNYDVESEFLKTDCLQMEKEESGKCQIYNYVSESDGYTIRTMIYNYNRYVEIKKFIYHLPSHMPPKKRLDLEYKILYFLYEHGEKIDTSIKDSPQIYYFKDFRLYSKVEITEASLYLTSNPQPIGFSGILLAKRQNSFYCTYFLHNRNVADTKSPYPIKRLEVIRWFNQKSMVFNQSLS